MNGKYFNNYERARKNQIEFKLLLASPFLNHFSGIIWCLVVKEVQTAKKTIICFLYHILFLHFFCDFKHYKENEHKIICGNIAVCYTFY